MLGATGGEPPVAPLPGSEGVAVIYTVGSEVYVTVQAYSIATDVIEPKAIAGAA